MEFSRQLECVAIFFSRGSCQPKVGTHVSCIAGRFFTTEPLGKPNFIYSSVYVEHLGGSVVKNLFAIQEMQETWVQSLGQKDPLEEGMATHSSILAWRIPWTEGLQSIGLRRVGHD